MTAAQERSERAWALVLYPGVTGTHPTAARIVAVTGASERLVQKMRHVVRTLGWERARACANWQAALAEAA